MQCYMGIFLLLIGIVEEVELRSQSNLRVYTQLAHLNHGTLNGHRPIN